VIFVCIARKWHSVCARTQPIALTGDIFRMPIDEYVYVYVHTYVYVYICVHICIHIYIHTYMYIHTCTYKYIYAYAYTYIPWYDFSYALHESGVANARKLSQFRVQKINVNIFVCISIYMYICI